MATTGIPAATLAFYEDHESPHPVVEPYEWSEIVALLTEHEFTNCTPCPGGQSCKAKFTLAFSPGAPRVGTSRSNKNIDSISLLVYDFDHLLRSELETLCERIAGLECILYSTHSHLHGGPDDCCVRLVFPLSRPLKPDEFRFARNSVIARFGFEWYRNGPPPKLVGADRNPKDLSRLFFLPTAPVGVEVEAGHQEGALIDLDEMLRGAPRPSAPRLRIVPPLPSSFVGPQVSLSVDMESLRRLLKSYRPDSEDLDEKILKKELVRRVYAGEPLVRPEEEGQREKSCHRLGKIFAYLLPSGLPEEAMVELARKSVSSMPVCQTDNEEDTLDARFAKLAYSYQRGTQERAARDAAFEAEKAASRASAQKFRERMSKRREARPRSTPSPEASATPDDELPDTEYDGWEELLVYKTLQDGSQVLDSADSNAETLLIYYPEWRAVLRYNELTKDVEIIGGPLQPYEKTPEQVTTGVKYWLQREHGLKLRTADVMDAILHAAKSNSYDPVRDYLLDVAKPAWDGQARINSFLELHCGAAMVDGLGKPIGDHTRRISRRWFISAVARALQPGCKMDTVLILEGEQGLKKSTAFRTLAAPWFTDSSIDITNKDSKMLAGRNWFIELSELSAMRAAESEAQKSFFSSQTDQFRPPYGRAISTFHRHSVFVGTTNDERYLNDLTGNRRYWPIHCLKIDLQKIRQDRDQLWGEAVAIFQAGEQCASCQALPEDEDRCSEHRWWLSRDENKSLEAMNNYRLKNEYADAIRLYLLRAPPNVRPESYLTYEVATEMLAIPADRVASQQAAIGRALKTLGFERKRVREGNSLTWRHFVPKELAEATQVLRAVPDSGLKSNKTGVK